MAKNNSMFPAPKRGGLLKVVLVVLLAGAVVFVIKYPVDAAGAATDGAGALSGAVDRIATFLRSFH